MRALRVGLLRPGQIDEAGHARYGPGLDHIFRRSYSTADGGRIDRGGSGQQVSGGF